MAKSSGFIDDLIAEIRRAPLSALPDIVAAVRSHTPARRAGASPEALEQIAEQIVALPGAGSKLQDVERAVVMHALETAEGNVSAAARLLGVDRKAMERRVARVRAATRRKERT